MSILNQSIAPIGQPPAQPSKGTNTQEASQLAPMTLPIHGLASAKSSQLSLLKAALPTHMGSFSRGQSFLGTSDDHGIIAEGHSNNNIKQLANEIFNLELISNQNKPCYSDHAVVTDVETQSFNSNMAYSFLDNGKMSMISETNIDNNQVFPKALGVLAISVSSAVKLDDRQIDLIARKMQRLTGFMNLRIENTVDESLIAGFVIKYSDDESQAIDLSVKGRLAMVAAQLECSDQMIAGYSHNQTSSSIKR